MKKIIKFAAAVVLLLVAAMAALPFFVSTEMLADKAKQAVETHTGRALTLGAPPQLTFFPNVGVRLQDVSLANAKGGIAKDMLSVKQLDVAVALLPLLQGNVQIKHFTLDEPVINLEKTANGSANWIFAKSQATSGKQAEAPSAAAATPGGGSPLQLGLVKINNASLSYQDAQSGQSLAVKGLNMVADLGGDDAAEISGKIDFNQAQHDLSLRLAKPRALLAGDVSGLDFTLANSAGKISLAGDVGLKPTPSFNGSSAIAISQLGDFIQMLSGNRPALPFADFNLNSKVAGKIDALQLSDITLAAGSLRGEGQLALNLDAAVPMLRGNLTTGPIDIDALLANMQAAPAAQADAAPSPAADAGAATSATSSASKIDLAALKAINLDVVLATGALTIKGVQTGDTKLTVKNQAGVLNFALAPTSLLDGTVQAEGTANGAAAVPSFVLNSSLTGVNGQQALEKFAGLSRIRGTANLTANITTSGATTQALQRGLNGNVTFSFTDGAIRGINIAGFLRDPIKAIASGATGADASTDFAELGGSFQLSQGVASSNDIKMLAPLFRMTASGSSDIPQQSLNFKLLPTLTGTLEGQGGELQKSGFTVPVMVTGSYSQPKITPDMAGVATNLLKDPGAALDAVKNIKESGKLPLPIEGKPADALKNLFGR